MRTSTIPEGEYVPTADHRVVMSGVPWSHLASWLRLRKDSAGPRVSYLQGNLELMSPSKNHERIASFIASLIKVFAMEEGVELSSYGSWTLKSAPDEVSAEPDECFLIGLDQSRAIPDLVIEVVWTSGGLAKLEIYRRLGVPEFWQWKDGRIQVHLLRNGRYVLSRRSRLLPGLDIDALVSFLDHPTETQAARAFRATLTDRARSTSRPRRKR